MVLISFGRPRAKPTVTASTRISCPGTAFRTTTAAESWNGFGAPFAGSFAMAAAIFSRSIANGADGSPPRPRRGRMCCVSSSAVEWKTRYAFDCGGAGGPDCCRAGANVWKLTGRMRIPRDRSGLCRSTAHCALPPPTGSLTRSIVAVPVHPGRIGNWPSTRPSAGSASGIVAPAASAGADASDASKVSDVTEASAASAVEARVRTWRTRGAGRSVASLKIEIMGITGKESPWSMPRTPSADHNLSSSRPRRGVTSSEHEVTGRDAQGAGPRLV